MSKHAPAGVWMCLLFGFTLPWSSDGASVLFVGNSFTQSAGNAGQSYNAANVTDLNGTGVGGVPGIFKKIAEEGGFTGINVTSETVGGETLAYHLANKSAAIGSKAWDWVVLQEYSTRPLISPSGDASGTNVAAFRSAVDEIADLVHIKNSDARVLLYETWARPDKILAGRFAKLSDMQAELRASYSAAATDLGLQGWAPVGDAFLDAIATGKANDPTTANNEGPISLWNSDNYHASTYGSYLAASIFYAQILGGDPRLLPTGAGSAAAGLGLVPGFADQLQEVAYRVTQVPEPSAAVLCGLTFVLAASGRHARVRMRR